MLQFYLLNALSVLALRFPYWAKSYNHLHNILRLFDVLSICFSTTTEKSVIIGNKHGIYELPHEFPNDLRIRT